MIERFAGGCARLRHCGIYAGLTRAGHRAGTPGSAICEPQLFRSALGMSRTRFSSAPTGVERRKLSGQGAGGSDPDPVSVSYAPVVSAGDHIAGCLPTPRALAPIWLKPNLKSLSGADYFGLKEGHPFRDGRLSRAMTCWAMCSRQMTSVIPKPIRLLVGMDKNGQIVGAKVFEHHEPILLVGIPPEKLTTLSMPTLDGISSRPSGTRKRTWTPSWRHRHGDRRQ